MKSRLIFTFTFFLLAFNILSTISPANAGRCGFLDITCSPPKPPSGSPLLDSRIFSWGFYVRSYEDLRREFGVRDSGAISTHWSNAGFVEGRQGAPAFNAKHHLSNNPDLGAAFGTTGNDAYLRGVQHWRARGISECRKSSPFYDGKFYLENNPDLRQAFGNDCIKALQHWLNGGIAEGRISVAGWNPKERVNQYELPATSDGYVSAMQEYLKRGGN